MSESSWTALAKDKERDWWSTDLEGEVEKLEVIEGPLSRSEGDSLDPNNEVGPQVRSDKGNKRGKGKVVVEQTHHKERVV